MELTEREKEVVECLISSWLDIDAPLYGGLAYKDVMELLEKLGVNDSRFNRFIEGLGERRFGGRS